MPPRQVAVWLPKNTMKNQEVQQEKNRDPVTGEPGSHPLGTGVGSLTGAATGAIAGVAGGPVGMAVGGVIGAIAGAVVGHGIAEELDPTAENEHWEKNYKLQPYYIGDYDFNDYGPAYRVGYEGQNRRRDLSFEGAEAELASQWEERRGESRLDWDRARPAAFDAWHRRECATPGTTDRKTHMLHRE
jgi:uncharacterized protein YcfJ